MKVHGGIFQCSWSHVLVSQVKAGGPGRNACSLSGNSDLTTSSRESVSMPRAEGWHFTPSCVGVLKLFLSYGVEENVSTDRAWELEFSNRLGNQVALTLV